MSGGRPRGGKNGVREKKEPKSRVKLTFDFTQAELATLDKIVDRTDASNRRGIVIFGIRFTDRILAECVNGARFGFLTPDGTFQELLLPYEYTNLPTEVETPAAE